MKKRLLTIIFAFAALASWAQTVVVDITSPEFSFEGDNLVMTTETANASIFYATADLPDLLDETITAVQNSLINLSEYYQNPIELKKNVVIKAITLAEEGGSTVQSDTTIYVYGYSVWQMLVTAMTRGNSVYDAANGNPNVDESLLQDLHWALEEGEMFYGMRGSAPHFEAEHFANMINNYCDEIEAIIGPVTTAEPYAVLSADGLTVTFYYDDQKTARGGMNINSSWLDDNVSSPYGSATKAVIDNSFASYLPTETLNWFFNCFNLTTIEGIANLKTDNVTNMTSMFTGCSSLTSLDLSGFNTANVTLMGAMFYGCSSLTSLDVSSFNTSNLRNMYNMFAKCSSLTSLDLSSFNTEKVEEMGAVFEGCSSLTSLDLSNFNTANVGIMYHLFKGCSSLTNLNLSSFNTANVTDFTDFVSNCSSLAAIQAGSAAIPDSVYAQVANPNLLVYVNDASLAPKGVQNVVVNGTAPEIILTDVESGNNNWYCPQPFTAQKISYTRNFQQQTQIGVSRGWETIALPFDVQTIAAEDSRIITPFGDYTSPYNFWLRRLTHNGLQSAQQIEANTPYLISMPNSTEYPEEYKLAGKVTFSAENASVPESNLVIDESSDIFFAPTFERMEAQQYIYAINVGEERGGHPEGSVFEQNYREVRPFEAYTKHLTGPSRFITLDDLDEGFATSIEELKNGKIEELKSKQWYDLNGRRVLRPSKGLYINNGRKVMMK